MRVGASIQSGQPPTSSSPHWSIDARAAARACPWAGGRASCRRGRGGARRRSRSGRGSPPAGRRRRAASRRRGSEPCEHRLPERVRRVEVAEVVLVGLDDQRARRTRAAKRSLISTGTMSSRPPWVSRAGTPSGSRSIGEATLGRMPVEEALRRRRWRGRSSAARCEVEHARLGDDAGDGHARILARRRPRREVAAGAVADRDHAASGRRRQRRRGGRSPRARRRASSGTPPPLPSRRYSMFHAAQPRDDEVLGAARPSASGRTRSFQKPPWMSTATGPSPYSTPYCEGSSP